MKVNGRVWSTSYRNFTLVSSCEETSPLHKDSRTGQTIENRENMSSCCEINSLCKEFPLQIWTIFKSSKMVCVLTTFQLSIKGYLMNTQYVFKKSSQKTVALYTLLYRSRWHGAKLSCMCTGTRAHAHTPTYTLSWVVSHETLRWVR